MAFWSDPSLDPKRQFKFKVTFGYLDGEGNTRDSTFLAQSADRPQYTITDTTKVDFLDKAYHFPGKISWNQVKIKFVDAISIDTVNVSKRTYDFLASAGWINPTEVGGPAANFSTISKNKSVRSLERRGYITVNVLSADGRPVDVWTLKNPFINTVALNNLDYTAEGVLTAEYTIRYDWADFESATYVG